MGRPRISHSVPSTSQSLVSIPSHCTNRQMGLHGTSQDIPHCLLYTSQSLSAVSDGTAWDILGHPTLAPVYLLIPTIHPIPLYRQTDAIAWDVPGHPTLSPVYLSNPTVHPIPLYQWTYEIAWDVLGHSTLSLASQSLLSIPSHCTDRQMGSNGMYSVPCLPLNSYFTPQSQLHVYVIGTKHIRMHVYMLNQ